MPVLYRILDRLIM